VVNRRELEYAVSGLSGPSYPPEDIKHMIDRLHTPQALRLLDLELTQSEEILPGIVCTSAGGHTEGSMLIHVQTDQGMAVFCGDLIYSVFFQLLSQTTLHCDPVVSANYVVSRRNEKAALKRLLHSHPQFTLFPSHDLPVEIDSGKVKPDSFKGDECGPQGCWCSFVESIGYSENNEVKAT
jgi:glyoxylase-like metal-dependent hydrolase (beta-lactamase superfamily II)